MVERWMGMKRTGLGDIQQTTKELELALAPIEALERRVEREIRRKVWNRAVRKAARFVEQNWHTEAGRQVLTLLRPAAKRRR